MHVTDNRWKLNALHCYFNSVIRNWYNWDGTDWDKFPELLIALNIKKKEKSFNDLFKNCSECLLVLKHHILQIWVWVFKMYGSNGRYNGPSMIQKAYTCRFLSPKAFLNHAYWFITFLSVDKYMKFANYQLSIFIWIICTYTCEFISYLLRKGYFIIHMFWVKISKSWVILYLLL